MSKRLAVVDGSSFQDDAIDRITCWEGLQRYLGDGEGPPPEGIDDIRSGLRSVGMIPSGKIGVSSARHPMPRAGFDETPLPTPLLAGLPVRYATALTAWLIRLHRDHRSDYEWLMDRWLHASNAVSGAMRLTRPGDHERALALTRDQAVRIEITEIHLTKSRLRPSTKPRYQMTVKLGSEAGLDPRGGEGGRRGRRSAGAVRWVMTWAVVAFESNLASRDSKASIA